MKGLIWLILLVIMVCFAAPNVFAEFQPDDAGRNWPILAEQLTGTGQPLDCEIGDYKDPGWLETPWAVITTSCRINCCKCHNGQIDNHEKSPEANQRMPVIAVA